MSILNEAVSLWGVGLQTDIAIEELSELTKVICKIKRKYLHDVPGKRRRVILNQELFNNIVTEIVDVQIMIEQMKIMFSVSEEALAAEMDFKLDRLNTRINEYNEKRGKKNAGN